MMDRILLGFPPLPPALERVSELSGAQFEILRAEIAGPEGLAPPADARLEQLSKSLGGIDESEISDLLHSLSFLYDRSREWEKEEEDPRSALKSFLKGTRLWRHLGDNPNVTFQRLVELLQPNPATERRKKLRWLRTGMLENAVEFASFVDLRPDFSVDRLKIEGLVPVIILHVRTESDFEEDRSHVFQLTADGLSKLRKVLKDVDDKVAAVNSVKILDSLIRKDKSNVEETP